MAPRSGLFKTDRITNYISFCVLCNILLFKLFVYRITSVSWSLQLCCRFRWKPVRRSRLELGRCPHQRVQLQGLWRLFHRRLQLQPPSKKCNGYGEIRLQDVRCERWRTELFLFLIRAQASCKHGMPRKHPVPGNPELGAL